MAERTAAKKTAAKKTAAKKTAAKKSAAKKTTSRTSTSSGRLSADERAALADRAKELKSQRKGDADGTADLLDKIAAMPDGDRQLATRFHEIVTDAAPDLVARTWYGMPAYAKDGDVLCFFQNAGKFKARYSMIGFSDKAKLDKGSLWPVYYAIAEVTTTTERELRALLKKAIG